MVALQRHQSNNYKQKCKVVHYFLTSAQYKHVYLLKPRIKALNDASLIFVYEAPKCYHKGTNIPALRLFLLYIYFSNWMTGWDDAPA